MSNSFTLYEEIINHRYNKSPKNSIFAISMIIILVSGLSILMINLYKNTNKSQHSSVLARGLWKFTPEIELKMNKLNQRLNLLVLILAGVIIGFSAISMSIKAIPIGKSLIFGLICFSGWNILVLYFWYKYVIKKEELKIINKNLSTTQINEDKTKKDDNKDIYKESKNEGWKKRINLHQHENILNKDDKDNDRKNIEDHRLSVTIVTGFLGSGKTTLVKEILNNTKGIKILVIENEIGVEGIDHDLLMQHTTKEEIILMNNGCICCTVRKDLLDTFHRLFKNQSFAMLDWIVIETTGLANPAPLIQSLYMDEQCKTHMRLDSVLTVVDSKHFPLHLAIKEKNIIEKKKISAHGEEISEVIQQIAYADRILINKLDLINETELENVIKSITEINPTAQLITCQHSKVPIERLLNIRAFDSSTNQAMLDSKFEKIPSIIQVDSYGKIKKKKQILNKIENKNIVKTISLESTKDLDFDKFNTWIFDLLRLNGEKIYRMKGILSFYNYDTQFVCHGVHMIFDGYRGPLWNTDRRSRLVFIGIDIDQVTLEKEFLLCQKV